MKDINGKIQYKDREYKLVFNLNVMETIQEEYGSIDKWGSLTDGSYHASTEYEADHPGESWDELSDKEKASYPGEPDAKAVIFGFTAMLNEGIDMDNDENGTDNPFLTTKQVGRMITEIGLLNATRTMNKTVIESTKSEEKNA